jgi:Zn-dependent peptidase ImmA (M78 family)/DNA-binding XRE family transcriptional regulator
MENILEKIDPKILGNRLQESRRARGLNQQDVGDQMNMARTTIVAIEKGERRIKADELIKFARIYGRDVSKLLNQVAVAQDFVPQFRQKWREDFSETPELERVSFELQQFAEDYLELERINGITRIEIPSPQYNWKGSSPEQAAEEIAMAERNRLGIGDGPISNLRERLEMDIGLRIFYFPMPSLISGLFVYHEALGGCIGINSNHPRDRRNWSLGHEFGHYLTNRYQTEITFLQEKRRQSANERLADAFAEFFLMPSSGLNRRFSEIQRSTSTKGITMSEICHLANLYQVSVQALVIRLEKLRRFPIGTWDSLAAEGFKPRQAQQILGINSNPPLEDELPRRYVSLAVSAYEKEEISEGQLAKLLRTDRVTARIIIDKVSFGNSYQENENHFTLGEIDFTHEVVGR